MENSPAVVTPEGRRISDRDIRRGMRINILAGCLGMSWWVMTQGMPLTMFMEALGASGLVIGLIPTVIQLSLLMQIPATFLTEHLPARKPIWGLITLLGRVVWFIPVLLIAFLSHRPTVIAGAMVGVAALSAVLCVGMSATWFSWMADLVPDNIKGRFWGNRQSLNMLAFLAALAVAGHLLDVFQAGTHGFGPWKGFSLVFLIGAVLGCGDIIIHMWVPEPRPVPLDQNTGWLKRLVEPLKNADFRTLTILMGVYTFSVGLLSLGIVYLKKDFHVSYTQLSALGIVSSLGIVMFGFLWGHVMDRIGARAFGVLMFAVAPLLSSAWFFIRDYSCNIIELFEGIWGLEHFIPLLVRILPHALEARVVALVMPQPVWILLFVSFFSGAVFGGVTLCQFSLTSSLAPTRGRMMAMAVHWSTVGLIAAAGGVTAGLIMDFFAAHPVGRLLPTGIRFSFHHFLVIIHALIIWGAVTPMLLRISRREGEPTIAIAFSRLLIANPLRTVTSMYLMGAAVSQNTRASAAHGLGRRKAVIAVSDLIEKLDDPSADVREASATALGNIGSAEAVDALVQKLDDPYTDTVPQIARALRKARGPAAVEALIRKLKDPDRETRSETARTLGMIGDRRAAAPLRDLLSRSRDPKIISSVSQAIARLGEIAAIHEILPHMNETHNPVLKRSLAVAVGDLLGEPDGFYRILTREQKTRGTEVARMMSDMRRRLKRTTGVHRSGLDLVETTRKIESLYEREEFPACAEALFHLAKDLASLQWGAEPVSSAKEIVNDVVWQKDQRFGAGIWYLDLLRQEWNDRESGNRDYVDILLGIYFLACRGPTP
jgi:HEAT repeat protein